MIIRKSILRTLPGAVAMLVSQDASGVTKSSPDYKLRTKSSSKIFADFQKIFVGQKIRRVGKPETRVFFFLALHYLNVSLLFLYFPLILK